DEGNAEPLHDLREAHRVFLDTLRGSLDVALFAPVHHVVVVHVVAPAADPVTDEEGVQHGNVHADQRQPGKAANLTVIFAGSAGCGLRKDRLNVIPEGTVPVVDG